MKRSIYEAIRDKIKELPWVKLTGLQLGQFDNAQDGFPLPLPTLLIGFSPFKWDTFTHNKQAAEPTVSIFAYFDHSANDFAASSEEAQLKHLDKINDIFQKLENFDGADFEALARIGSNLHRVGKGWVCYKTDFTTRVYDIKT